MKAPFKGVPSRAQAKRTGINGSGASLSHRIPPHSHQTRRGK